MKKKVAFVTGASRGIGRGIALTLAEHGFDIVGAATQADPANTEKGLYEVKAQVEQYGSRFLVTTGNIAEHADHTRMVEEALETFGAIDVLVNNAGVAPEQRMDILEMTDESYARVMEINLWGAVFLTQKVANEMIKQVKADSTQKPKVIFITSVSATTASPNRTEYCISKAGLSMAAQCFAVRLAEFGINVCEIQPGIIETDMTEGVREKYDAQIEQGLLLQKRWGTPEDVGKAVAACAEGYLDYATGSVIEVGGGLGVHRL